MQDVKSLETLAALAVRLRKDATPLAVATLVRKEGSTYRQPGARMLVDGDGHASGMISGGCLEREVTMHALQALRRGVVCMRRYDLTEDNALTGYGAGCSGVVHALIEPHAKSLDILFSPLHQREGVVVAHLIGCQAHPPLLGARQLWRVSGPGYTSEDWPSTLDVRQEVRQTFAQGRPHEAVLEFAEGSAEVFFELVRPPVQLYIFGSGPDVAPLVTIAKAVGWRVTVAAGKAPRTLEMMVPGADAYLFLMHPDQVLQHVEPDTRSAAVVMNHNLTRDTILAQTLIESRIPYVGVLGPRARVAQMLPAAMLSDTAAARRIYGPVGLDIGGESPQEVALSIVAEVQAVLSGTSSGSLRDGSGPVHQGSAVCAPLGDLLS